MARVFVSGSSTGLGLLAGRWLAERGHEVTLHARTEQRTAELRAALPQAALVLGDLSRIADMRNVAEQVNALGRHDAVIHNAAVYRQPDRIETTDGLSLTFAVNVLAPYLLSALIERPDRLVYLTSGLQNGAAPDLATPSGPAAGGTGCRPTPRASCSTRCWRSASPGAGPRSGRTRSARAGCRPGWAARARRTTSPSAPRPRRGSPPGDDPATDVTGAVPLPPAAAAPCPASVRDPRAQEALFAYCAELTGQQLG